MTPGRARLAEFHYGTGSLRDGTGSDGVEAGLTARAVLAGAWEPDDKVVDVGCGRGATLSFLGHRGFCAIGVDVSPTALAGARQRDGGACLVRASGDSLPFDDCWADGIIAECSFSLMPDPAKALAEFHRVLRPRGRLVITDVYARAPDELGRPGLVLPQCLTGVLEKDKTTHQMRKAGFHVETWEDHSDVLRAFMARFIFSHGSLCDLWGGPDNPSAADWVETAKKLRLGYVLLSARKPDA